MRGCVGVVGSLQRTDPQTLQKGEWGNQVIRRAIDIDARLPSSFSTPAAVSKCLRSSAFRHIDFSYLSRPSFAQDGQFSR
jgi:hypothetical protein